VSYHDDASERLDVRQYFSWDGILTGLDDRVESIGKDIARCATVQRTTGHKQISCIDTKLLLQQASLGRISSCGGNADADESCKGNGSSPSGSAGTMDQDGAPAREQASHTTKSMRGGHGIEQ
jgi:hypothetical protein